MKSIYYSLLVLLIVGCKQKKEDNLDQKVDQKKIKITVILNRLYDAEVDSCQVMVFGQEEKKYTNKVLNQVSKTSILTVGESEKFLEMGGHINFLIINNTVQFEINQKAIEAAGLSISSKVLRLANKVISN